MRIVALQFRLLEPQTFHRLHLIIYKVFRKPLHPYLQKFPTRTLEKASSKIEVRGPYVQQVLSVSTCANTENIA